jgi:hypothetical protein
MVLVFLVLVGITWAWQRKPSSSQEEPTPTAAPYLLEFDSGQVKELRIQEVGGRQVILQRQEDGWMLVEPTIGEADEVQVSQALIQLSGLRVLTPVEEIAWGALGLVEPKYTITLLGPERLTLYIGGETPTGSGYYVRLSGQDPVVVPKYALDALIRLLEEPPLVPTETPSPTSTVEATEQP